jgi:tRNA (guanine-N7-)-methyltransferase
VARSGKLHKIVELNELPNVFQSPENLKGNWRSEIFENENPIIVEVGCGRGEYTLALGRMFPQNNYIGIDVKGARLWKGAKTAYKEEMPNVAFVRTLIETITDYFAPGEVNEVWVTFPDPYPRPSKTQKRLISKRFLDLYRQILVPNGIVHFKTDNEGLFQYAMEESFREEGIEILAASNDLYNSDLMDEVTSVKTTYEGIFSAQGHIIKYAKIRLV